MAENLFQYYGSKWEMADWIVSHLDPRHHTFVDACGGSGAIILHKPPSPVEVFNDIDAGLVNFFHVLRDQPVELAQRLALTPYSRAEYEIDKMCLENGWMGDAVEKARRWATVARQSANGIWGRSWSRVIAHSRRGMASSVSRWLRLPEAILQAAGRFQGVQIECLDVLDCILQYDTPQTLFYVDPPYHPATRNGTGYVHEMTAEQHDALLGVLCDCQGGVVLSGYGHVIYDEALANWGRVEREVKCRSNVRNNGETGDRPTRTEVLWIKPLKGKEHQCPRL